METMGELGTKSILIDSQRNEMLWLLERRLEDIRQIKGDLWKFSYSAIISDVAILIFPITKPNETTYFYVIVSVFALVGIFYIWVRAHRSAELSLASARNSKRSAYNRLGDPFGVPKDGIEKHYNLPEIMRLSVAGSTLLSLSVLEYFLIKWNLVC
jgi:hypothetical protein